MEPGNYNDLAHISEHGGILGKIWKELSFIDTNNIYIRKFTISDSIYEYFLNVVMKTVMGQYSSVIYIRTQQKDAMTANLKPCQSPQKFCRLT